MPWSDASPRRCRRRRGTAAVVPRPATEAEAHPSHLLDPVQPCSLDPAWGLHLRRRGDGGAQRAAAWPTGARRGCVRRRGPEAVRPSLLIPWLLCPDSWTHAKELPNGVLSKTSNSMPMSLPKKCYLRGLPKLSLGLNQNDRGLAKVVSCLLNSSPNLSDLEIHDPYNYDDRCISSREREFWEEHASTECVHIRRSKLPSCHLHSWKSQ